MKLIICLTMAMMSCSTALLAGSFEQLGGASGADPAGIKTELPRFEKVDIFQARREEMKALVGSLLMHPEKYTEAQLGDLIANIDVILGSMARSSPERDEFNALRDAVSKELDNRVGGGRLAALTLEQLKAEAREKAEAVLKDPASFSLGRIGGALACLDVVRGSLAKGSSERKEFDALREAVGKEFKKRAVGGILAPALEERKAEAREKAEAVLKSPGSFTLSEIGGVLSKLDVVRSCLPKASSVRAEFDARREAVNKVFGAHP